MKFKTSLEDYLREKLKTCEKLFIKREFKDVISELYFLSSLTRELADEPFLFEIFLLLENSLGSTLYRLTRFKPRSELEKERQEKKEKDVAQILVNGFQEISDLIFSGKYQESILHVSQMSAEIGRLIPKE